ncbi:MAG TPA: ATP-binding protein, partial [Burkholderiales bacterium]|nr:ATP-binding protein [Burkholderiales bacterium]
RIETQGSEPAVSQDVATGIFRIFQESLTNIARHADAASVLVKVHVDDEAIRLIVTDDGKGIGPNRTAGSKSLGILGMSERAQALGGTLSVHPAKPGGTTVSLSVPHERRASERPSDASTP